MTPSFLLIKIVRKKKSRKKFTKTKTLIKIRLKKTQPNIIMKKAKKLSQNLMKQHKIRKQKKSGLTAANPRNREEKRNTKRRDNQGRRATKNRENSVKRADQDLKKVQESRKVSIQKRSVQQVAVKDQNLEGKVLVDKLIAVRSKDRETTVMKGMISVVMREGIEIMVVAIGITKETAIRNKKTREITDKIYEKIMEERMTEEKTTGTITKTITLAKIGEKTGATTGRTIETTIAITIKTALTAIEIQEIT
jgi:hypothetical protein